MVAGILLMGCAEADMDRSPDCGSCNTNGIQIVVTGDSVATVRMPAAGCAPFTFRWSTGNGSSADILSDTLRLAGQSHISVKCTDACGNIQEADARLWPEGSMSSMADAQGNRYATVRIGHQTWMAENLRTDLPHSYCFEDVPLHCDLFGRLYPWYVAVDGCPDGWHLPTDDEWKQMEIHLGMDSTEAHFAYLRGEGVGGKLRSVTYHWDFFNDGATNESGFSALPGGPRYRLGQYGITGHNGTWWTATEVDSVMAWFRYVGHSHTKVGRLYNEKMDGHSVRCVKDRP
jgi:uncharacterized protein (TIGR02145 family)